MERNRRWFVVLVTILVALTASGTATAKCKKANLPKGNPSVREYSEPVQTVCGTGVTGTGDEKGTKLPSSVEQKVNTSRDAGTLKDLATNPRRGAPQPARGKEPARIMAGSKNRSPVGASLNAATSGNDATLIALISVMGAAALAAALTAIYRRRLNR